MYKYIQTTTEKKTAWRACPDDNKWAHMIEAAPMTTILAVGQMIEYAENDEDFDTKSLRYRGPLYFDIDSQDINASIQSAIELCSHLMAEGVQPQDLQIWATGKKGFHILIDQQVFGQGKTKCFVALPWIYREMAQSLFVENLDMVVYSGGRGRMWRTPNVQRENGQYKVPLTFAELEQLNPQKYEKLCSESRELEYKYSGMPSLGLTNLFDQAQKAVHQQIMEFQGHEQIDEELLAEFSAEDGCIQKLVTKGDKDGSNFNQAAMQLAAFVKVKYTIDDRDGWMALARTMAKNVTSGSYRSEADRLRHIKGAIFRAFKDQNFVFSRRALFKVIRPCGDCLICKTQDGESVEMGELDFIEARPTGYFAMFKAGEKQLTTFTIEPTTFYTAETEESGKLRTGVSAKVLWLNREGHSCSHTHMIPDDAWNSRSSLIRAMNGIGNCAVYANDAEIQRLRHSIFRDIDMIGEIHEVKASGFHWYRIGASKSMVYVEPSFSLTSSSEIGTHKLVVDNIQAPPTLFAANGVENQDQEMADVIRALCKINDPHVVAQCLGWTVACFLKQQIITKLNQFPLLNLYGNAGSGKSKTAHLMGYLHGCDYEMRDSPLDLETTTPYAITAMVASSTTVVRIIDEVNPSLVPRRVYDKFVGVAKAAWAGLEESKGTLSSRPDRGAAVSKVKLTGPILYLSEQPPERPALRQRTVMVGMSQRQREVPGRESNFMYAFEMRHRLADLGKEMVATALRTTQRPVHTIMAKYAPRVPTAVGTRAHYSYTVVLTGLEWLQTVTDTLELGVHDEIQELIDGLLEWLCEEQDNISKEKSRSESDIVIEAMSTMAAQPSSVAERLIPGLHYFRRGNELMVDTQLAFPMYAKFSRSIGDRPVVANAGQLRTLLRGENYHLGDGPHPTREGTSVTRMDLLGMRTKGIQINNFREEDEEGYDE
jgi:hypothetical protein